MRIIFDYLLFLVVRVLLGVMGALPMRIASDLGAAIAGGIGPRIGLSRKITQNLSHIYPDMTHARQLEIIRGVWRNLGRTFAEFPHLSKLSADDPRNRVVGGEQVARAIAEGRQIIFASMHIGNWEWIPHYWGKTGLSALIIYRAANNPFVNKIIQHYRDKSGLKFAAKGKEASKQIIAALSRGGHVALLMDQRMSDGDPVDFMGKPALTGTGWLRLALKYRALIIPVYNIHRDNGGFEMGYGAPIDPAAMHLPADPHAATQELAKMVNDIYAGYINQWPEQWLWLHKRWGKIQ